MTRKEKERCSSMFSPPEPSHVQLDCPLSLSGTSSAQLEEAKTSCYPSLTYWIARYCVRRSFCCFISPGNFWRRPRPRDVFLSVPIVNCGPVFSTPPLFGPQIQIHCFDLWKTELKELFNSLADRQLYPFTTCRLEKVTKS